MKIKLFTKATGILSKDSMFLTTVGYWAFTGPSNTGTLDIQCLRLPDWRFTWAVVGHELIEALWCKMRGITTEQCDVFDHKCEEEFKAGTRDPMDEPGFDPDCCYRAGHVLGSWWEMLWITLTFAGWDKYDAACSHAMRLDVPKNTTYFHP